MISAITISEVQDCNAPFLIQGMPFSSGIALASNYGFDGVELQIQDISDITQDVLDQCRKSDIKIVSLATGQLCRKGMNLASNDADIRDRTVTKLMEFVDFASEYGNNCAIMIGLLAGRKSPGQTEEDFYMMLGDSLKRLSDYAEKKKVPVNLEPVNHHDCNELNTWDSAVSLLEQNQCNHIKIGMDLYHMRLEEKDIVETISKYSDRIGSIQIMDDNRWPPGYGNFKYDKIISAIKETNYNGAIIMECLCRPDMETAIYQALYFYQNNFN